MNNTTQDSSSSAQKSSWLAVAIMAVMGVTLLSLAAGARMEEGRFVYRTYLLITGGLGATAMALALHFKK